ncbi:hypothetical protein AcW2_004261 [Taiwanofungus camphoratus]|nr:hypothetical protein AcW2_004261 [Antrodia cinnamomea]
MHAGERRFADPKMDFAAHVPAPIMPLSSMSSSSAPSFSLASATAAQGFHFTYSTRITTRPSPAFAHCSLHLLHSLVPDVYADPYELLHQPAFASSLRGTPDLELPVAAADPAPSLLLLNVSLPAPPDTQPLNVSVDVPLHARYARPEHTGTGYHAIVLPPPVGFWACPSTGPYPHPLPDELMPYLSPDAFPVSRLAFPRVATGGRMRLTVPVGRSADLALVDVGTALIMLLAFLYLAFAAVRTARRLHVRAPEKTQ